MVGPLGTKSFHNQKKVRKLGLEKIKREESEREMENRVGERVRRERRRTVKMKVNEFMTI